ncbi:MAG: hypothetical protein Q4A70_01275 [Candidatus Saccharibacteria bacterium]|nr:hypothetical protein [Candidatus Saccharibacteria bacterium]
MTKVLLKQFSSSRYYLYIILSITVFSGFILSTTKAFAEDTDIVDQVNITVPESCTMSGTGMNTHNAEIQNNTYTADIGTTTLHAFCNDNGGFAIYAVGYTGNEIGGTNSTKLVGSPSTIGNIDTGTAINGNTSNWAMKLTKTQDSGNTTGANAFTIDNSFGDYHAVPSSYTKVAHKDTATDMTTSTGGVKLTTTYAAFINKTQPAGTYSGQVKYTLVHPASEIPTQPIACPSGYICYNPNGSNVVGTMGQPTISSSATSATLLPSNFSREGYGFAGWSTTYDYSDTTGFLGPQEYITFTAGEYTGSNPGLSLYAHWIKSAGNIQDWSGCSSLASGSVTALTDQRDNETYAVAKLADDNCWMIENLRLESTNSDNATGALAEGYGTSATYGNFSGLADAESMGFSLTYTANSLYYSGTRESTASVDIGTTNYPAYRMPRYNNWNNQSTSANRPQNPITSDATNSTTNAGMYSYGNYYTWHAAISDLTYNGTANQSTTSTSLCPKGWHLPTGGLAYASDNTGAVNVTGKPETFSEFYNLGYTIMDSITAYESNANSGVSYYGSNTINTAGDTATKAFRKYPNNFIYSGHFSGSSALVSSGFYWSSTASDYESARYLVVNSSNVRPGTNESPKYYGGSVRCLSSS